MTGVQTCALPILYIYTHTQIYIYTHIYIYICIYTHTHTHNGVFLGNQKNEILPFATTWRELEGIMLSEISQKKTNII